MAWQDEVVAALGATERSSAFDRATWAKAEAEIRCVLPPGFKALIDRLGAGCIGEFIWLPSPSHVNTNLNTADMADHGINSYAYLQREFPTSFPRPRPPKEGAAIPFACTADGEYLSFICGRGDPDNWPVAFCHHGTRREEVLAADVAEFFSALVECRLQTNVLPGYQQHEMKFDPK